MFGGVCDQAKIKKSPNLFTFVTLFLLPSVFLNTHIPYFVFSFDESLPVHFWMSLRILPSFRSLLSWLAWLVAPVHRLPARPCVPRGLLSVCSFWLCPSSCCLASSHEYTLMPTTSFIAPPRPAFCTRVYKPLSAPSVSYEGGFWPHKHFFLYRTLMARFTKSVLGFRGREMAANPRLRIRLIHKAPRDG